MGKLSISLRVLHMQGDSDALAGNSVGELLPQMMLEGALHMAGRDPACFDVRRRACSPAWQPPWGTCSDGPGCSGTPLNLACCTRLGYGDGIRENEQATAPVWNASSQGYRSDDSALLLSCGRGVAVETLK